MTIKHTTGDMYVKGNLGVGKIATVKLDVDGMVLATSMGIVDNNSGTTSLTILQEGEGNATVDFATPSAEYMVGIDASDNHKFRIGAGFTIDEIGNTDIAGELYVGNVGGFGTYENLAPYSNSIGLWSGLPDYYIVNSLTELAPDGTNTACEIDCADGGGNGIWSQGNMFPEGSTTYTMTFWAKAITNPGQFAINMGDGAMFYPTMTSDWQEFKLTGSALGTTLKMEWGQWGASGPRVIQIWNMQIVYGSTKLNYIDTGSTGVLNTPGAWVSGDLYASDDIILGGKLSIGIKTAVSPLHVYEDNANTGASTGITIEQDGTGDAAIHFKLTGLRSWMMGVDHSDSRKFKIVRGTDFEALNYFTIDDDTGYVSLGHGTPTAKLHVHMNNALTGLASGIHIHQEGAGDASLTLQAGAKSYNMYIDNSDSDKLKVSDGTTDFFVLDTSSLLINPQTQMNSILTIKGTGLAASTILTVEGDSLQTGGIASFYSNSSDAQSRHLVIIHNDNANAGGAIGLKIQQDSIDTIALLLQGGTFAHDSYTVTTPAWELEANSITSAYAIDVQVNGLTTGGILKAVSASPNTSVRTLVSFENNNAASSGTTIMKLTQAANQRALTIEADGVTTNTVLHVSGDELTSGALAHFHSFSDSASIRSLVNIINDHPSAIQTACLTLQNDATGGRALLIEGGEIEINGGEGIDINDDGNFHMTGGAFQVAGGSASFSSSTNVDIIGGHLHLTNGSDLRIYDDGDLYVGGGDFTSVGGDINISGGASVGINATLTTISGHLNFGSSTKFVVPRMTTEERDNITPTNGQIIYNTNLNKFQGYENQGWYELTVGG
jgi:hypothetical protein